MSEQKEPKLPTLAELHHDPEQAFKNDKLNLLLNQPPHASWIKKHPQTNHFYLPIDKIEYLLRRIFQRYRIEVLREAVMLNAIAVTVRVHYCHPLNGEWHFHDGVGAWTMQLDSKSVASDLSKIKSAAVQMALPIAKSLAIKDACDHFGTLFGSDLNRKDTIATFNGSYTEPPPPPEPPKQPTGGATQPDAGQQTQATGTQATGAADDGGLPL